MAAFFRKILYLLAFIAVTASATVTIEGDTTRYNASAGDTLSIAARKKLNVGENFVKWELVSGAGVFTDETADSSGFILASNDATIKMVTQTLPIYELTDQPTKFIFYKNSVKITAASLYGIRVKYKANEGGLYALVYKTSQPPSVLYFAGDSTFTKSTTKENCVYTNSREVKCIFSAQPNSSNYYCNALAYYPNHDMKDSIFLWVLKANTVTTSFSGNGAAYVDSSSRAVLSNSRIIELDTTRIYAVADSNNIFDHWEVTSGTCSILDSKKDTTKIYDVKTDCKIKAVFNPGPIYTITNVPVGYNFADNLYAKRVTSGHIGVRFTFTAPSAGSYTFVASNDFLSDSLYYFRYTSTDYKTISYSKKFRGTLSETVTLTQGQVVSIIVGRPNKKENPFYISYATQAYSIALHSDGNGKVTPDSGYATAFAGAKYTIAAEASDGYRFSDWQIVAGTPVIEDAEAPNTYITTSANAELKARFKQSSVYPLTKAKQTFNFQKNYYRESTHSTIRFSWTPPDTATYLVSFEPIDPIGGIFSDYGTDSTFAKAQSTSAVSGITSFTVKGAAGVPLYLTLRDSANNIPNKSFKAWISTPYVLNVLTAKEGSVNPAGKVYTAPGVETILTAWPYGGYRFKSWVNTEGDMTISSPKNSRTSVTLIDSLCSVKATFTNDESAEPLLNISKLDISNYPEVCAQISITDKNSGHSFYGLVSEDFTLTQDGKAIQPQVTSINNVTGVSVVIVVDESTSMLTNNRMEKAKDAIRAFINDMGPYDRTSIVGFKGAFKVQVDSATKDSVLVDSTVVHQTMTSNRNSLLQAVDSIKGDGKMTNIITGTIVGLEQIVNETNATVVIVFSDGDNNSGSRDIRGTIEQANTKKTPIYSIALESDSKYPLANLAEGTGGTFSLASDASELAGLYAGIRDNVLSQYVVCYQTPDTVQNGETHDIILSTKFNKITTKDSAQWSEKSIPPSITLTEKTWELIKNSQESNNPLTISAYIRTQVGISYANLYMRTAGTTDIFTIFALQNVHDSLWEFTVPANLVIAPGLEFYIIAGDNLGQTGKTPKIQNPSKEPYTIFVDNDIPTIEPISIACEDSTTDIKSFIFNIKDSDGIDSVVLYFRDSKMIFFQEVALAYSAKKDYWIVEFPANIRDFDRLDYYVRVTDARGTSVRNPSERTLSTDACRIHYVANDTTIADTTLEDTITPSPRDSIVYSLIADTAEIYDKDLDGHADYVRIHFKEERDDNISSIDSVFWNSNRGEWRFVPEGMIKKNRTDGKWFEGYINTPYKYGLTKADSVRKPFLGFTTIHSDKMEYVMLTDKVGAVPTKATKNPGKMGLTEYMDPKTDTPPDTLIVRLSEPVTNIGDENAWEKIFRYSTSCKDTASQPISLKHAPQIRDNGQQWVLILDGYNINAGFCLFTDPEAPYEDLVGNALGRGGIEIEGKDGMFYLDEVKPVKVISGIGKNQEWIPPEGSDWEALPDSISAISVKAKSPYTAEVYIFDGIATYVTHFEQKFGYDGEMEDPKRGNANEAAKLGFLHWNQRSEKGRKVGTGIYIWKIFFKFEDGHKETRTVKTGVYRKNQKKGH